LLINIYIYIKKKINVIKNKKYMMSLQQRISKKLIALILVCSFIGSAFAETIYIEVGGGGPDNLKFVPQKVTAKKGDTVSYFL
jgi:hypothetical protein